MALRPEAEELMDDAYDGLAVLLDAMIDEGGFDQRALIAALGRHYIQFAHAEFSAGERLVLVEAMAEALK